MEQISLMHVLLIGLRGCGMEIGKYIGGCALPQPRLTGFQYCVVCTAKCLALSGVQRLTLMDDELVRDDDLIVGVLTARPLDLPVRLNLMYVTISIVSATRWRPG
jgi:hypothetical protein